MSAQVIEDALAAYLVTNRSEWVVSWPGQAVLCVSQKYWTAYVHESIRKGPEVGVHAGYFESQYTDYNSSCCKKKPAF